MSQPGSVVGRVAIARGLNHVCLLNQRVGKLIFEHSEAQDRQFIYYLLSSHEFRRNIALMAHGAASQANVSPKQIESLEISLPPLQTQQKIASIFSAYDDLIENNNRRIQVLEEMAQRIYREWFVHFRFPGHENVKMVDSELGKIPEGWTYSGLMKNPYFQFIEQNSNSYSGTKVYYATADVIKTEIK